MKCRKYVVLDKDGNLVSKGKMTQKERRQQAKKGNIIKLLSDHAVLARKPAQEKVVDISKEE